MSHRPDDRSAPKEYYTNEDVHGLFGPGDHTNLSAPVEALQSSADACPRTTPSVMSFNKKILKIPPRRLAFCGGGIRCVAHVGVLKAMHQASLLSCVKEVIGVSAGALFALLYVLGYSLEQIEELSLNFDFRILGEIGPEDLLLFPMTFGLNSGNMMDRLVGSILHQKFDRDITFAQLAAKTRIGFRCYATELQTSAIKEMSATITPNMMVRTAVCASMSLPIMYSPVSYGNSMLVDGGLLHNLPLVFLTDAEVADTWGVLFVSSSKKVKTIDSVVDFFKFVYDGIVATRNAPCIQKYKERLIVIESDDFNALSFGESKEARIEFIRKAEEATRSFLLERSLPRRRVSVC